MSCDGQTVVEAAKYLLRCKHRALMQQLYDASERQLDSTLRLPLVLDLHLELDVSELLHAYPALSQALLRDVHAALGAVRVAAMMAVTELVRPASPPTILRLFAVLMHVPTTMPLAPLPSVPMRASHPAPLTCAVGRVSSIAQAMHVTWCRGMICPQPGCHEDRLVWLCDWNPMLAVPQPDRGPAICAQCRGALVEDERCRVSMAFQMTRVVCDQVPGSLLVQLTGAAWLDRLELGTLVRISGVIVHRHDQAGGMQRVMLALGVDRVDDRAAVLTTPSTLMLPRLLPDDVMAWFTYRCPPQSGIMTMETELHRRWLGTMNLCQDFAAHLIPPWLALRTRLALLLTLVGSRVHLCFPDAACVPLANRLAQYTASMVPGSVIHVAGAQRRLRPGMQAGTAFANDLLASQDVLVVIMESQCLKRPDAEAVSMAQADGRIVLGEDQAARILEYRGAVISLSGRNHLASTGKARTIAPSALLCDTAALTCPWKAQDMVMTEDDTSAMIGLLESCACDIDCDVDTHRWRCLLHVMRRLQPELSDPARVLLQGYYLALRTIDGTEVSARSLEHLVALAAAHARLAMQHEVDEADALVAIMLYETSRVARCSTESVLHLTQVPAPLDVCSITRDYGDDMLAFRRHVQAFIRTRRGRAALDPGSSDEP